jgi:hypothetical protein
VTALIREPPRVGGGSRQNLALWLTSLSPVLGLALLAVALLAPLAAYATLGWFARYTADDYCTAAAERVAGYLGAQWHWYQTWSGRFTYYATVSLIELAGPSVVQVLPAVALALWVVIGAWAVRPIATTQGWPAPWLSAGVVGAAVVFVCISGAPDLDQALYWQTGMLTYLLPLILLTAFAGWLNRWIWSSRRRNWSWRDLALVGLFLFVSAGISETTLSLQLVLAALAAALSMVGVRVFGIQRLGAMPALLTSGVVATALAGVVVVGSPGNVVHETSLTGSTHPISEVPQAIQASVDFVGLFTRSIEFRARPAVLILLVVCGWLGFTAGVRSSSARAVMWHALGLGLIVVCGWVLLLAATIPGYFAQGWDPPERAQFVAVWVVAVCAAVGANVVGRGLRLAAERAGVGRLVGLPSVGLAWPMAALVLAVAPLAMTRGILAEIPARAEYAAEWDAADVAIRSMAAAGEPVLLERSLPRHFGFDFIGPDPTLYPNPCVAQFYGVSAVVVSES